MKKAFTLIELLVVVTIIAVLITLLLPVLKQAKASSGLATSTQSLHELIIAGHLYLNDNNHNFWPYEQFTANGTQWWFGFETWESTGLPEGQRYCDYSQGPLGPYTMTASGVKTDPTFLQYSPRLKPKYQNGNYGYGYNTVLASDANGNPHNEMQVTHPAELVVFATSAQVNTFESPASPTNPMIEEFYMINDTEVTTHFRHGRNALAAFLDGSVRAMSMATDMQPGSQDMRIPSANIGILNSSYVRQAGW